MNKDFWHERWDKNETAFHESFPNQLLTEHFEKLSLKKRDRVFVPLCGMSEDMIWLLQKGFKVVGVELSEKAVTQFFHNLGVQPKIETKENFKFYCAQDIEIFVGDLFKISPEELGDVDALYDRAALVALPDAMRDSYTKHLTEISKKAKQLLITFDYDQSKIEGPPFSIDTSLVYQYYQNDYHIELLEKKELETPLKGVVPSYECAWFLS